MENWDHQGSLTHQSGAQHQLHISQGQNISYTSTLMVKEKWLVAYLGSTNYCNKII